MRAGILDHGLMIILSILGFGMKTIAKEIKVISANLKAGIQTIKDLQLEIAIKREIAAAAKIKVMIKSDSSLDGSVTSDMEIYEKY